jgi:histidinol-phosphate aminotransferase
MCYHRLKMIKHNKRLDLIEEYLPSKRSYDNDIKKLDWNECNLPFNKKLTKIIKKSLSKINYSEYPNINNELLNSELSKYCGIPKTNIQTFNGSDSSLQYIFTSYLNENSRVLIFYPNYNQIEVYIKLLTDKINYSKINNIFENSFYDFSEIENNDVIYFSNPNNPTGLLIEPEIIEGLLTKYPNKLFIIDEAYYEFSNKSSIKLVKDYSNIIVTRTFSKALSLASIRLGYICADESIIKIINKIRNTKEVNSFAQTISLELLKNYNQIEKRISKINLNKFKFTSQLKKLNIPYVNSESNFVLIKVKDSKILIEKLFEKKILIRDRSMFDGLENCVRITIGKWSDMKTILKILKKYDK